MTTGLNREKATCKRNVRKRGGKNRKREERRGKVAFSCCFVFCAHHYCRRYFFCSPLFYNTILFTNNMPKFRIVRYWIAVKKWWNRKYLRTVIAYLRASRMVIASIEYNNNNNIDDETYYYIFCRTHIRIVYLIFFLPRRLPPPPERIVSLFQRRHNNITGNSTDITYDRHNARAMVSIIIIIIRIVSSILGFFRVCEFSIYKIYTTLYC